MKEIRATAIYTPFRPNLGWQLLEGNRTRRMSAMGRMQTFELSLDLAWYRGSSSPRFLVRSPIPHLN
jgi:hypothetical protein